MTPSPADAAPVLFGGWLCTGRYLGTCKNCKTVLRVDRKPVASHFPILRPCSCGKVVSLKQVFGSLKESTKCDARCTGAKGHDCECSCNGRNHGADR